MTTHQTRLQGREEIASGTMAFHFEKPAGFSFKPGQAIDVVLLDPPTADAQSARHTFSIVSAPFENELVVATRMRDSAFKRALKARCQSVRRSRSKGRSDRSRCTTTAARPAVFIAGGIGITPFMSMLRQATKERLPQRLLLLYSNRRPQDAAFLAELQRLERQNRELPAGRDDDGAWPISAIGDWQTGLIDEPLIEEAVAATVRADLSM